MWSHMGSIYYVDISIFKNMQYVMYTKRIFNTLLKYLYKSDICIVRSMFKKITNVTNSALIKRFLFGPSKPYQNLTKTQQICGPLAKI